VRPVLKRLTQTLLVAAVAATPSLASAEIPIAKANDWTLSLDGRLNTFVSYSFGQAQPLSVPTWQGVEDRAAGTDSIAMTRIRSGFISNVLGFTLRRPLSESTNLTGRFAIWVGVSQARNKADNPALDAREVYFKVEGPWGGVLAGRNLALFSRGGILLDYEIEHGYGLGHPCAIRTVMGAACGHAGHGVLFPSYNAGIVYNTPELAGLQLSVGAYDPAANSERTYERTPYPRIEAEATYHFRKYVHAFVGALWQRFGSNTDPTQNPDATGVNYGAGVNAGPVQLGFTGYFGLGLGLYEPLENSPLFSDDSGVLRKSHGYLGLAALNLGNTKLAGGFGTEVLEKTLNEPAGPFPAQTVPKSQTGLSAGLYQTIKGSLVLALEYFRGTYQWYPVADANGGPPIDNQQIVNFVNVGATVVF
jgi:predicted porin